ncbi:MAG: hypothetical protein NC319_06905 [Butyricicoccus sp.]|nr:hypothetical protein [Butyricicoccus sp.]
MRKIITLLCVLAVGALGLLCSCGDGRPASASEKAGRLVSEWDAAALNLYRYSGRDVLYDGRDGYMVVMTPDADSFADGAALRDYQTEETVRQCADTVYEQLATCFGGDGEVYVIVAVCDGDGKAVFTFLNGVLL